MLKRLSPPQIIAISFLCAIVVGAILLNTPLATKTGQRMSLIDSLFTATSATCVTGLVVKDTGAYFSSFGQAVILILLQIGGLGIMTFSVLFAIILGRKLTLRDDVVIKRTIAPNRVQNLTALIVYILLITFGVELLGALCLGFRWHHIAEWSTGTLIINSIFHSISAFCNAGFSLFPQSFSSFSSDVYINIIMIALIVLGGIGFIVLMEIPRIKRKSYHRISIQTKVALTVSICLIVIGAALFFILEKDNTLFGFSTGKKTLCSFFQSVTSRTAGFNTVTIGKLATPTLYFFVFLMFIGASPGSTGGGIKTVTFGVIIATLFSMMKNRDRVFLFKKTIPKEVVRKSLAVLFLALAWIFVATFFLAIVEYRKAAVMDNYFLQILFEVTSAFGTVGLSTGVTPGLTSLGKLIITATMFAGRIGPLTLAIAVALQSDKATTYIYPEEKIMIG